ncbi:hypothetical protein [Kitasatospora phosalacinea]|uniref:hypothetical protein n=1 Tax=Kitasatospora phosalacinea TaxID=2065 RepID=UPI00068AB8CF|nr:hypothetical protein [Kitasatospora phosalacinea]
MRIRRLAAAAALLTVTLAATGCDPEDASDTGSTGAAPTATAATTGAAAPTGSASKSASKPAGGAATGAASKSAAAPVGGAAVDPKDEAAFEAASMDPGTCGSFYKTHKVLLVESVSGGQLKGRQEKVQCGKYGREMDDTGVEPTVFKLAPGFTAIVLVKPTGNTRVYPRYQAKSLSFEEFAKDRKPCFDSPDPDGRPTDLDCGFLFVYDTDSSGAVTGMHETWVPTD